ncbi:MAG: oxalate:formate antiporter [Firmicutes bacterium]|nr:oxalate:formate antiporter [Bacillota bacterium]
MNNAIDILKTDLRILGIAAGGSWITNSMDEFSDIDLVIVVDSRCEREISAERLAIAEKLGNLLSGFTGEHVGEPRLLICLYGSPLLHVDLKFVVLADFAHRVEDPVILWEREQMLSEIVDQKVAVYPSPSLQWIEDRFWVWVHYVASKLGRGEIFEALESLSFLRITVLGPLALMKNGCLPRGMRYIERDAKEELALFMKTVSSHSAAECAGALKHVITLYQQLRNYHSTPDLVRRKAAEEQSIAYLNDIISSRIKAL